MSLPPVPKNWHWAKGTPAGGLHAWLGQLRGLITDLESRSGTSVAGSVATFADLPTTPEDGQSWIVRDEVALYTWSAATGSWAPPVPVNGAATEAAVAATIPSSPVRAALVADIGTLVPVTRLGVRTDLPNTDQSAAIQAAIDLGVPLYFPPGRYVARDLLARNGMRLSGAGKGDPDNPTSPRTILRTHIGDLFTTIVGGAHMGLVENMELSGTGDGGNLVTGWWSQFTFRSVRFLQYRPDRHCINVYGWIDNVIEGASEILAPSATVSGGAFRGVDSSARIAQFSIRDTRVRGGVTQPAIHLEATHGGLSVLSSATFDNVNFEVCNGGCLRLLSVRGVHIRGCGVWDLTGNSGNPMIDIGEGGVGGAPSGQITIDGWLRDNTTIPGGGDIRATAATFGLNIINPAHHASSMHVYANGAAGRLVGSKATLHDGQNMDTDFHQTYTPVVSSTTLGNGAVTGRYQRRGREVAARIALTIGSTTTVGNLNFSLPVPPIDGTVEASAVDASTGAIYNLGGYITAGVAAVRVLGTNGALASVSPTAPFPWAAGDTVLAEVRYRAA